MNLTVGKVIRKLRTKRGMSQEKLAEYMGVAPQSVSKWERGEGYPDITFLIPLAEFFDVSLDVLMGRDEGKTEMKIRETVSLLKKYNHLGDHERKNQLAREAYREYPFDFRIIRWYISALFDVEDIQTNKHEISNLCRYVIHVCTEDEYRYEAITSLAELYSQCGEYDRAVVCAKRLPDMQACREFASCCLYPDGDERDFQAIATFIENAMERMLWLTCRMAVQRTALAHDERIGILEQMRTAANVLYPDFDFGMCHSSMEDICLVLFRLYSEEGQTEKALNALEEAFRHGKALDDCGHGVIKYTSPLLRGHTFDMSDTWDGSKCNSVWWLLERLQDSCRFAIYDGNARYQQLLDMYRPYAVEDKTR